MTFEALHIPATGATLAARHYAGAGDPIVLLHGGPGMGDYFDRFPETLSPPHRVLAYDQRGCGASSCNGSFAVHDHVADLDAIRSYLRADRIHVFGHSWGGLLGQLYAKAHSDRVASLVLCCSMANTGTRVAAMESRGINERVVGGPKRSRVAWIAAGTLMQFPGRLGDLGYGFIMRQLMPNYVVHADRAPRHFDVWRTSKRAWQGTSRSIKELGDDYLASWSLGAPVLIVQGDQDVIRETNALLAARFPSARNVWIKDASHFPWLEQPEEFAGVLLDFYRTVTAPAAR